MKNKMFRLLLAVLVVALPFVSCKTSTDEFYGISILAAANGSVTASDTSAREGAAVELTFTADEGFVLVSCTVKSDSGTDIPVEDNAFIMPAEGVTVTACFAKVHLVNVQTCENGTVTASLSNAIAGEEVVLSASPSEGYSLEAYNVITSNGSDVSVTDGKFTMPDEDVTVSAAFSAVDYSVTVTASDNGTVTPSKTTAHVGDEITLDGAPSPRYGISSCVVTTSGGTSVETVSVIDGLKYTFVMPPDDVNVTVEFSEYVFHETVTILPSGTDGTLGTSGTYVYFGDWPKTIKASTVTVDETISMTLGAHTYYAGSDGSWYAKVLENGLSTDYKYSDGTSVAQKDADSPRYLYFKVEPIKWRVLTDDYDGKKLLLAEDILTADVPYYDYRDVNRTISSAKVYTNNYQHSAIRAYLNGLSYQVKESDSATQTSSTAYLDKGFLQTAFTENAQELIASTIVDNSVASTTDSGNYLSQATKYACSNTTDKIFLLSEKEVTTSSYGFAALDVYKGDTNGTTSSSRIKQTTDYAKANYAFQFKSSGKGGRWWLRSPQYDPHKCYVRDVECNGAPSDRQGVTYLQGGVSPALSLSY